MENTFWAPSGQNELYHFGVKGMKWGVRKNRYDYSSGSLVGKRRKLQGELNRTDKQIARDRYGAHTQYKKLHKAISKNKSQEKVNKIRSKYDKYAADAKKGEEKTRKLLKDVAKSGYTVKSKPVQRAMVTGKDVAIMVASAGYIISWTSVSGTKYKVKAPKE